MVGLDGPVSPLSSSIFLFPCSPHVCVLDAMHTCITAKQTPLSIGYGTAESFSSRHKDVVKTWQYFTANHACMCFSQQRLLLHFQELVMSSTFIVKYTYAFAATARDPLNAWNRSSYSTWGCNILYWNSSFNCFGDRERSKKLEYTSVWQWLTVFFSKRRKKNTPWTNAEVRCCGGMNNTKI